MAKYTGPSCRLCKREGAKLFLKGNRCVSEKCAFSRRSYSPGQHGKARVKLSNYGLQLREKQKLKRIYNVLERQFKHYFKIAEKSKSVTGKVLLQLLERRLDNVIFRMCFAASRVEARQMVSHGWILVNGKKVDIPSYLVKEADTIQIENKEKSIKRVKEIIQQVKERGTSPWIEVDYENLRGKIIRLPEREDIQFPIQEQLIVELYSK